MSSNDASGESLRHRNESYSNSTAGVPLGAVTQAGYAKRLLIGVAWGAIALLFWFRFRCSVQIQNS